MEGVRVLLQTRLALDQSTLRCTSSTSIGLVSLKLGAGEHLRIDLF